MRGVIRTVLWMLLAGIFVSAGSPAYTGEAAEAVKGSANSVSDAQLLQAIQANDVAELRKLITAEPGVVNRTINGLPLLHLAIQEQKQGVFSLLINDGANINVLDSRGRTPLILAAQRVMPEFGSEILATGKARQSVEDNNKRTAMSYVKGMTESEALKRIETYDLKTKPENLVERANEFVTLLDQYEGTSLLNEKMVMGWLPKSLRPLFQTEVLGRALWRYAMSLLIILLILLVNTLVVYYMRYVSRKYDAKEEGKKRSFIGMTILAAKRAFKIFTWGFGLYLVVALLMPQILESAHWFTEVISSVCVALFIYDFTSVLEYYLMEWASKTENTLDDTLVMLFRRSMRIGVVILVGLHVYHAITNNPITGVLAGLGIGSMAVALAATDTIKNLIGFFMILMDKPFTLGERIVFDGHDGVVQTIGMRTTRIRRLDGHEVSIPNSKAVDSVLHNVGRRPFIKRVMNIGLTYDTSVEKMEKAIEIVKDILKDHEGMNPDYPPLVFFSDMKADCLNIDAYYWYFPAEWAKYEEFSQKVNLELMRRFEAEGLDFAFPSQTIYLADDPNRRLTFNHKFASGQDPFTAGSKGSAAAEK